MQALEDAKKLIERHPDGATAKILSALVLDLECEGIYSLSELYNLDREGFALALKLLTEWRLDRNSAQKAALLDLSSRTVQMSA